MNNIPNSPYSKFINKNSKETKVRKLLTKLKVNDNANALEVQTVGLDTVSESTMMLPKLT